MIIDLTAKLHSGVHLPSGDPLFSLAAHSSIDKEGFCVSKVSFGTHQGTHIDAPSHIIDGGKTLSDFDAQRFVVRALLADVSHLAPKGQIDVADLLVLEPEINPGMGVVIRTGWDKHIGKKDYFTDAPNLSPALAQWLVDKKIGLLGIDMPCPCVSDWQHVHEILLGGDVLIVESLVNLAALDTNPFTLYALPLNLVSADGSPVRAIAITD